jgi:integrase
VGCVYKRGKIWWVAYYQHGKQVQESARTTSQTEAKRLLKEREGKVATGQPILHRADRVTYREIAHDLQEHYETTGARNLEETGYRLAHLGRYFKHMRVTQIGSAEITAYARHRQREGAANATINRELETLSRMLRLAFEHNKLARVPVIHKLQPSPPRQGFFEPEPFEAVKRYLSPDLQLACTIMYTYGWRVRSEVLMLQKRHVDLEAGTLRLDPGGTKNDDPRVVYLTPELKGLLAAQLARVSVLERETGQVIPHLFPHLTGPWRGERIQDFKKRWKAACVKAGCPGMLRHDFRRTAVRNLVNSGVPEHTAMKIAGHRSRTVFDRYAIVSAADLQEATRKLLVNGSTPSQL